MFSTDTHTVEFTIKNKLGFHVRPTQRVAEMAQAFESDVQVQVGERDADGKSVLQLMGLHCTAGSQMQVTASGPDAEQCTKVIEFLGHDRFFVEDHVDYLDPERHLKRLAGISSCFESDIEVEVDGQRCDAKDLDAIRQLNIEPTTAVEFDVEGPDADQARAVLQKLAKHKFYVEEKMGESS